MKTSRIGRIINLLTAMGTGQNFSLDDLSNLFALGRRTIYRDLNELKKMGIPCRHNAKTGKYSINSSFLAPPADLNSQEAMALLLLARNAKNLINLPLENSALIAAIKIEHLLESGTRHYCDSALKKISIQAGPRFLRECSDKIYSALHKAILEKRVVRVHCHSPYDNITTDLNPYHLLHSNGAWHVFGDSSFHRGISSFQLNYLTELNLLDKHFVDGEDFDVHKYIGIAWATKPEGTLYDIKLRFLPEIAASVAYVKWHNTQAVTFNKDGSVIMEFRVDGLNEILWWILSYGDRVHVICPKVLQDRIADIVQNTATLYGRGHAEQARELVAQADSV